MLHAAASMIALGAAIALGRRAVVIVAFSLLIGIAYSLRPVRLSYRTYLAPLALAVAYVAVPYALGAVATGRALRPRDALLLAALYVLFVARIVLKDFRDREGDALYGKPTLLLRFGKDLTCAVSFVALLAGNCLLVAALRPTPGLTLLLELFVLAIAAMLHRLRIGADGRAEQVAIGIGARMGNGLLIVVLAWLVLDGQGAPPEHDARLRGSPHRALRARLRGARRAARRGGDRLQGLDSLGRLGQRLAHRALAHWGLGLTAAAGDRERRERAERDDAGSDEERRVHPVAEGLGALVATKAREH